ncbi:MAG TPA: extracellular solute-binding protein [Thermomicrobiales bacterium]|jgi:raffinose/stachyose/melibiose transport system substrate-binding protein
MSKNVDHRRLSRRGLIKATGGIAGAAALAGPFANLGMPSASAQATTTVSLWGNHPEWKDPMQEIVDAFQAANPDVKVELTELSGPDYTTKLQTAVAGGQPSDILGAGEGEIISKWIPSGDPPFIDLTGKIDVSGLTDSARTQVTVGGKDYGCPLAAYTVGLAIQNPVFAKHNLTPPTTWDELKTVAQALKDAGETPIVLGGKDWVHTFFMYIGLASSVLGLDGLNAVRTGQRKLTDPDLVAATQLLIDLMPFYNAGFEATDYTTAKAIFANEKGAMMVAGTADFTGYRQVNPNADLSFVAWPGPEAGKKATTTGFELLYTASKFASAEKQAAATKFVNWLATTEAQQLVSDKIALPINKNVTESSDPIRAQTLSAAAEGDVPVWYDLPELNPIVIWMQKEWGGIWTGRLDAQAYSAALQGVIVPSGGTGTPTA